MKRMCGAAEWLSPSILSKSSTMASGIVASDGTIAVLAPAVTRP